jgi:hypothetical protein
VNWKSVFVNWKSVFVNWKSVFVNWKSVFVNWKSVFVDWESVYSFFLQTSASITQKDRRVHEIVSHITKRHRIISTDSKFHRQTSVLAICRVSSFVFLVTVIWFLYFCEVNLPASKKIVQKITITISVLTAETSSVFKHLFE